jgi:hypothetical protein
MYPDFRDPRYLRSIDGRLAVVPSFLQRLVRQGISKNLSSGPTVAARVKMATTMARSVIGGRATAESLVQAATKSPVIRSPVIRSRRRWRAILFRSPNFDVP